jgi:hypothetical protein
VKFAIRGHPHSQWNPHTGQRTVDTADKTLRRRRERQVVGDADRVGFIYPSRTGHECADIGVKETCHCSGYVTTGAFADDRVEGAQTGKDCTDISEEREGTHGHVEGGINVNAERPIANCRVQDGTTGEVKVISGERSTADGGVSKGKSVKQERVKADGRVGDGTAARGNKVIKQERATADGGVHSAINVKQERVKANCRVVVGGAAGG